MTLTKLIGNEKKNEEDLVAKAINNKTIKDILEQKKQKSPNFPKGYANIDNLKLYDSRKAMELALATENTSGMFNCSKDAYLLKNKGKFSNYYFTMDNALYSINRSITGDNVAASDALLGIEEKIGFDKKTGLAFNYYCDESNKKDNRALRISDSAILAVAYFAHAKISKSSYEKGLILFDDIKRNMKLFSNENGLFVYDSIDEPSEDIFSASLFLSLGYVCINDKHNAMMLLKGAKKSFNFDENDMDKIALMPNGESKALIAFYTSLFAINSYILNEPEEGKKFIRGLEARFSYKKDMTSKFDYLDVGDIYFNSSNFLAALAYMAKDGYEYLTK
jgi:hypothetical protein